ncbi:MAG: hypothetical protein NTV51_00095 [Verrucomicrobia bacterium]|nr:hypothetical protein [Verrucomicrobiota bacterium]
MKINPLCLPIRVKAPAGVKISVVHDREEACLAVSIPRGENYKTVVGYYLTELGKGQLLTALLDWRYVDDELPKDETIVLVAASCWTRACEAFRKNGRWYHTHQGGPLDEPVYAWTSTPFAPPQKGGAS